MRPLSCAPTVILLSSGFALSAVEIGTFEGVTVQLGAEATAIAQVPSGAASDQGAGTVSADLSLELSYGEGHQFFLDLEAGRGEGLDARIDTFHGLNGDAVGDAAFDIAELWYAKQWERTYLQVGHIDITDNFDTNAYANDETGQFLAGGFINGLPVTRNLDVGPGAELWYDASDSLRLGLGVVDGEADWDALFATTFAVVEADYSSAWLNGGTYRVYAWYHSLKETSFDGSSDDERGFGIGFSGDQAVSEHLGLFLRLGWGNDQVMPVATVASLGAQLTGGAYGRSQDAAGIAIGYAGTASDLALDDEVMVEVYYGSQVADHLNLSANVQYVSAPAGDGDADDIVTAALRATAAF